jgi:hypothetical protein
MSITKELYDDYVKKSFFTQKNFSGNNSLKTLDNNMIPFNNLSEFHYQTSFFLNLYASLYIELKKYEETISYNITTFANTIENLGIIINNSSNIDNLTIFVIDSSRDSNYNYTFYYKKFEAKTTNHSHLYTASATTSPTPNASYTNVYSNILLTSKPNFGLYPNTLTLTFTGTSNINFLLLNKSSPVSYFNNRTLTKQDFLTYMPDNKSKLKEILGEIFSQTPENILGYLLYKKIYYNIILYNISIQNSIRINYLNETGDSLLWDSSINNESGSTNIQYIKNNIENNTSNITELNNINFSNNNKNEFLLDKIKYSEKINILNTLKTEYSKVQDKLNISTKLYNQQFKNYKSIKTYATYIIIALILILILIISISIFPIFSLETKNALYIILLIILIVITFLYYTNFKYVNLYEKFTGYDYNTSNIKILNTANHLISISTESNKRLFKENNKKIFNYLLPFINNYMNAYNDILNNMRLNVYTIGNKTFSQDANIYLYNMYLEKKRQIEVNNIKLTNLFNMIEIIKKQITYLFNIIFLISCFSIILLIALVIYSIAPQLYIFIIILCVILISMLMIYFSFAIIQPTRMIENKNYWASLNPSKFTYSKL